MEDIRTYRSDDESQKWPVPDDERGEWSASSSSSDDEVPFHIPRD